jgi:Fe-S cluster assembly protein SufD
MQKTIEYKEYKGYHLISPGTTNIQNIKENENVVIVQDENTQIKNLEINVSAGATLTFVSYYNKSSLCDSKIIINLEKDASLKMYNLIIATNDQNITLNADVNLKEEHANCEILNVYLGTDQSLIDSKVHAYHVASNTNSDLSILSIGKDSSTVNINNMATIKQGKKKCVVHQKAKGLALNKETTIKALPILYIDEADCLASHASAIGSISKDDLFYLMSRGLTKLDASKLIVLGFIAPFADKIDEVEGLKDFKEQILNDFIKNLK